MIRRPPRSPLFPYPTLFRSTPLPPYFGSRLIPSKPSSPHLRNTSRGKIPARSHSRAKGVSSRSTNERTVLRNISCSSVNGSSIGRCFYGLHQLFDLVLSEARLGENLRALLTEAWCGFRQKARHCERQPDLGVSKQVP